MTDTPLLQYRPDADATAAREGQLHVYGPSGTVCDTDARGHATPGNLSPLELVVDSSEGFIPLWDADVTLRWRFQDLALQAFLNVDEIKTYVRTLLGEGILAWGDAAPVRFTEAEEAWDFEIVVSAEPKCYPEGCVTASAFLPDAGRHALVLYPTLFNQTPEHQITIMAHELGHVFGLRHFFAEIHEADMPSEGFGGHDAFTIMNYGEEGQMTDMDQSDLTELYRLAWTGEMTELNGTPIRLVRPFSENRLPDPDLDLIAAHRMPKTSGA